MNKIIITYMAAGSEFIVMIQVAEMECSVSPYLNSVCSQDPFLLRRLFHNLCGNFTVNLEIMFD